MADLDHLDPPAPTFNALERLGLPVAVRAVLRCTPSEARIFTTLLLANGGAVAHAVLARAGSGQKTMVDPAVVKTHICRLRCAMDEQRCPGRIVTVKGGLGYSLDKTDDVMKLVMAAAADG
jgi:DNA-binding response OmpR family regulator